MKRILLSLLILQILLPVVFIAGCVSAGKTGTLEKDNLSKENILKEKIGMQYWMIRDKAITFYSAPSIPLENFTADNADSFVVEELIINGSRDIDKFYKVKLMPSGKTAYLLVSILNEDYSIYKTELSTEDPKRVKKEIRKLTGISEGESLWFTIKPDVYMHYYHERMYYCFEEVILKSFDFTKIGEITEGNTVVTLYFLKKYGEADHLTLNVNDINSVFYTKEPFTDLEERWGYEIVDAIRQRRLLIGMTEEQAMIIKGVPYKKNRSVGAWDVHEQWVYRRPGVYLYFEKGKLTGWQETR